MLATDLRQEREMHNKPLGTPTLFTATGRRKYLTSDERQRFLSAALRNPRCEIGTLCALLAYTGCRISEAIAVTAASIDFHDGFVAIRCLKKRSKSQIIREVPLPPDLLDRLRSTHMLDGGHGHDAQDDRKLWRLSRSRAWQIVKAVMADAGIGTGPHASPKGLRHGFGIHAIRSGVPINLVQRWLGHASLTTTAIYLQAMGREERALAARMWRTLESSACAEASNLIP